MSRMPFSAVVGLDDARIALLLGAVDPGIGGVLLTGEKGTAKTTLVRGLADLLPSISVVAGCRFSCDPSAPDPGCPDGPHPGDARAEHRPVRLVELPLGATDDRLTGSLDVPKVLSGAATSEAFTPGLLAAANRGVLYVDEVNLLPDHLVDVLLDAAATGTTTVEREGMSLRHASQFLLVGTMNPEEGELRPQLLDRFGLCVPVVASDDPARRADAVRARLTHDRDPEASTAHHREIDARLTARIAAARASLGNVMLADDQLLRITSGCAALGVDGLRGDLVTSRTAIAHAAWNRRDVVDDADVREAARLALPHRRRRGPFDDPSMSDAELDDAFTPPEPDDDGPGNGSSDAAELQAPLPSPTNGQDAGGDSQQHEDNKHPAQPRSASTPDAPFAVAHLQVAGIGSGGGGRRSRSASRLGHAARVRRSTASPDAFATLRAATLARPGEPVTVTEDDLRQVDRRGKESNLVVLLLDTSGSMSARRRSRTVTTTALSLLTDSYRRRDRVALLAFRGETATVVVPPTRSVDLAARRLDDLPVGGRTPLVAALTEVRALLRREAWRDPTRRPLLVVITDGKATGRNDNPQRVARVAHALRDVTSIVIDAEDGPVRLGLAATLARELEARCVRVADLASPVADRRDLAARALADLIRNEEAA
ncbi:MAG TPA: VWA domain-containing protein [Mycobacteriales bacterium]|nr:VWA domain-containing protein [Mycobacteriales bacterium]